MSLQWRREVSHASVLLRVRCGQDSLVACRLASSGYVHAATSLLWAHAIIARVHFHHRRQMLETLIGMRSVMHNGYAYRSLALHDPHSEKAVDERGKFYSVDPPWELCPVTPDARHVCATYPWATFALVFACGRIACLTKNITNQEGYGMDKLCPGTFAENMEKEKRVKKDATFTFLRQEGKGFWLECNAVCDRYAVTQQGESSFEESYSTDVLLRRRLPY
jgi:hypothetical protein